MKNFKNQDLMWPTLKTMVELDQRSEGLDEKAKDAYFQAHGYSTMRYHYELQEFKKLDNKSLCATDAPFVSLRWDHLTMEGWYEPDELSGTTVTIKDPEFTAELVKAVLDLDIDELEKRYVEEELDEEDQEAYSSDWTDDDFVMWLKEQDECEDYSHKLLDYLAPVYYGAILLDDCPDLSSDCVTTLAEQGVTVMECGEQVYITGDGNHMNVVEGLLDLGWLPPFEVAKRAADNAHNETSRERAAWCAYYAQQINIQQAQWRLESLLGTLERIEDKRNKKKEG